MANCFSFQVEVDALAISMPFIFPCECYALSLILHIPVMPRLLYQTRLRSASEYVRGCRRVEWVSNR